MCTRRALLLLSSSCCCGGPFGFPSPVSPALRTNSSSSSLQAASSSILDNLEQQCSIKQGDIGQTRLSAPPPAAPLCPLRMSANATDPASSSSSSPSSETQLFQTVFQGLVNSGVERNAAAAKALLTLQEHMSGSGSKETITDKMDIEFDEIIPFKQPYEEVEKRLHSLNELQALLAACASEGNGDFVPFGEAIADTFLNPAGTLRAFGREVTALDSQRTGGAAAVDFEGLSAFAAAIEQEAPKAYELYSHIMELLIDRLASQDREKICEANVAECVLALEYPGLMDPSKQEVLANLLSAIDRFPEKLKTCLFEWVKDFAGLRRYVRYITLCRQYMTMKLYEEAFEDAKLAARVMGVLYTALPRYRDVSIVEFYNDVLNEEYMADPHNIATELREWTRERLSKRRSRVYLSSRFNSFISYSFALSPAVKATVLRLDAENQMRREIRNEVHNAIFRGDQFYTPFLVLRVSRERVLSDTLSQIMLYEFKEADFKLPLKVVFDNEEGVDAGGVRKEYFQIMMKQLLDPCYGMFQHFEESRLLWFNADSLESTKEFELVGLLLGIAIYNSTMLDLPLPLAVYRKLKGQRSTLRDLHDLQPSVARGLQQLLDFEGDVEGTFQFTFQLSYEMFGEIITRDLRPDGGKVAVTNDNREEYVRLYVEYLMDSAVRGQFVAFEKGFREVCGGQALDLFAPEELELLVCGHKDLDFAELRRGATYDDGYDEGSQAVANFWAVLGTFSEDEKRLFLKFVSGSDRSPIDGLSGLRLIVSRNGDEDSRLPSAHTCFNHLLLPDYSSEEVMRERIKYSMEHAEGFGLR